MRPWSQRERELAEATDNDFAPLDAWLEWALAKCHERHYDTLAKDLKEMDPVAQVQLHALFCTVIDEAHPEAKR